jgi:hypothetical protein
MNSNYRENGTVDPISRRLFTSDTRAKIKAAIFIATCLTALVVVGLDVFVWRP